MPLVGKKEEHPPEGERRRRPRDFKGLKEELWSQSAEERRLAAMDLIAYPEAVRVLEERLKVEEDNRVKHTIVDVLYRISTDEAISVLVELLKSEDAYLRNQAIELLSEMPQRVEEHIRKLMNSRDPDLRIFAVNIMSSLKNPEVKEWLREILHKEEDPRVAGVALDFLLEIATEDFLPLLKELRQRFKKYEYIQFVLDMIEERLNA